MTNVKISQLPTASTPLTGVELVPLVQGGVTRSASVNSLKGPDGVRYFQTYATMTALTVANGLIDGAIYETGARTTALDGGEGFWRYNAGSSVTANGGTILASDTGTGRFFRLYSGDVNVQWFGVSTTNSAAANDVTLAAFRAWLATQSPVPTVYWPDGIYAYTTSPNWGIVNLQMNFGNVTLNSSNSSGGDGFTIDSGATLASGYCWGMRIAGQLKIAMLATGGHAVFIRGLARSSVAIKARSAGSGKAAFRAEFAVANDFTGCTVSNNDDGGFANGATPAYGVYVTRRATSSTESSAHNNWGNTVIEGVTTGVYLDYSTGEVFSGPTIEGCVTGIQLTANCTAPRFINLDFEANTTDVVDGGAVRPIFDWFVGNTGGRRTTTLYPGGYLYGMKLTNDGTDPTNDILFAGGSAKDSTNAVDIVAYTQLIKRLDATWAAGTNAGGRMSAAAIADTTYHCFAIYRTSDGGVDFGFDVSATSPTLPTGYTHFRRIGSIIRLAGAIRLFTQLGDQFLLKDRKNDIAAGGPSGDTLYALTVPDGIQVQALLAVHLTDTTPAAQTWLQIISPDQDDTGSATQINSIATIAASGAGVPSATSIYGAFRTNTTRQVRVMVTTTTADHTLVGNTFGWIDDRGQTT